METSGEQQPALTTRRQQTATVFLAVLLVLSPIKFAGSVSSHVFSNFPQGVIQFVLTPWPVSWVPVLSAITLFAVMVAGSLPSTGFLRRTWIFWIAPLLGFLASLVGWLATDNYLQPISFSVHMAGVLVFTLALLLHIAHCPQSRKPLLIAFSAGIVLLCIAASYEYFWSYKFTLSQLEKVVAEQGPNSVDPQIIARLRQNRPQAGFPIPNSLGGHFVLVTPFLVALLFMVGNKVDPPHVSRIILPLLGGGVLCFFIYTTKSRAATLSLFIALLVGLIMVSVQNKAHIRKHLKAYLAGLLIWPVLGVVAYLAIRDGRSLSSLDARLTYWEYGWQMFIDRPFTGAGIGEFFHHFVRMKPEEAETARLPHSMFIFFASGCGLVGIMAVIAYLATPVIIFISYMKGKVKVVSPALLYGSLVGLIAWILHTQTDFNIHIPASLMAFSVCLLISIDFSDYTDGERRIWLPAGPLALLLICAFASALRMPGDYYLAVLDQGIAKRRSHPQGAPPLETLLPLVESGSKWSPGSFLFWERFGSESMHEQRYDLALRAFSQVVTINPHYAPGHFRQATALARLNRIDEARTAFKAGLEWNPNPVRYNDLKTFLFGRSKPDDGE